MNQLRQFQCGRLDETYERARLQWILTNQESTSWTLPDDEFLELAEHTAIGEWEIDPEQPMAPDERQRWLDLFHGCRSLRENVLELTQSVVTQHEHLDDRRVRYEVADRLGQPHYTIELEVNHALLLEHGRRELEAAGKNRRGLVYFSVDRDACQTCRRLYLKPHSRRARAFRPEELLPVGANRGKDLQHWEPTQKPLHLGCRCMLMPVLPAVLAKDFEGHPSLKDCEAAHKRSVPVDESDLAPQHRLAERAVTIDPDEERAGLQPTEPRTERTSTSRRSAGAWLAVVVAAAVGLMIWALFFGDRSGDGGAVTHDARSGGTGVRHVVTTKLCWLRKLPSTEGKAVGTIGRKTKCRLLQRQGGWTDVLCGRRRGWLGPACFKK